MMKKLPPILTVFTSFLVLSACTSSGFDGKPPPDLTFQNVIPLRLPVSDVSVERAPGYDSASNAQDFVVPFSDKIESYIHRKMQAVGGNKHLRTTIEEASVKKHFEPSPNKFADFLDVAGHDVYDLGLILNIRAEDQYGGNKGVRLKLGRTIKISEHASIAEREKLQTEGAESLFRELDTNVTRIVLQELDLIPYQQGAPVIVPQTEDQGVWGQAPVVRPDVPDVTTPSSHPRVITGGPSTGGGSTGASTGAIERQEL
ncbi:MAG: hypothetical protein LRY54_00520 [Alphaproteobacteria bacterium]|nr:hypothetical protein [Alphaproteobacteria bacterium]